MHDYKELNNTLEYIDKVNSKNNRNDECSFSLGHQVCLFGCGFSYAGLLLISVIASIIGLNLIPNDEDLLNITVNSLSYLILFAIFIVFCILERNAFLKKLGKLKNYFIGLGMGFALIFVEVLINIIIMSFYQGDQNANQTAVELMFTNYPTISFIILCLIGPFCEELTYRVGLFDLLKRKNKILAYIVEVLIFAFVHIQFTDTTLAAELAALPVYLAIGLCLTITYDKFDLPGSFMAHVVLNSVSFIATFIS